MHKPNLIDKYRYLFLFIVMVSFFIAKSFAGQFHAYDITSFFLLILIIYSVYIISHKRGFILMAALITGMSEMLFLIADDLFKVHALEIAKTLFAVLFFSVMTYACLKSVLSDKRINVTTLFGSLCAYFFIGLFWSYLYMFLITINANSFTGIQANLGKESEFIYYSFVTLTTLGYGDVTPVTSIAKTVSWLEAFMGQAYMTLLMAQLVGRYIANKDNE